MMAKIVVDGENAVFGRMSTFVTKELLKGNFVDVINCEEVVISGDKKNFVAKIMAKRKMGAGSSLKGPLYIRKSDMLVKRMIRGMLPWDRPKGREAFKRLRCYTSEVEGLGVENKVVKFEHHRPEKSFTIKEVVRLLK
jgi:large subunit ribosomal protein L13